MNYGLWFVFYLFWFMVDGLWLLDYGLGFRVEDSVKGMRRFSAGSDTETPAASAYVEYSVSPSIRPIFTRYYFTMTNMIRVCSNLH